MSEEKSLIIRPNGEKEILEVTFRQVKIGGQEVNVCPEPRAAIGINAHVLQDANALVATLSALNNVQQCLLREVIELRERVEEINNVARTCVEALAEGQNEFEADADAEQAEDEPEKKLDDAS